MSLYFGLSRSENQAGDVRVQAWVAVGVGLGHSDLGILETRNQDNRKWRVEHMEHGDGVVNFPVNFQMKCVVDFIVNF